MSLLTTLPASGKLIITIILFLFFLAIGMMMILKGRYHILCNEIRLISLDKNRSPKTPTLKEAIEKYKLAYYDSGMDVNTPAIVDSTMESNLKSAGLMERFLKNIVSLLITLGLLGTFIGLTMAVGDLSSMFDTDQTADVLATLEIVGSGLLSSLSGMGIAFTTSLVGIGCSIAFTIINIIVSPMQKRTQFMVSLEDYLDNALAPQLTSSRANEKNEIIGLLDTALGKHSATISNSLEHSAKMLQDTAIWLNDIMKSFGTTCDSFNGNVRDFSEFNQNLRNNIERMDVNFIRLVEVLRENSDNLKNK